VLHEVGNATGSAAGSAAGNAAAAVGEEGIEELITVDWGMLMRRRARGSHARCRRPRIRR
jgi:hypothetical protein